MKVPEQLQNDNYRFVKCNGKMPMGKDWQNNGITWQEIEQWEGNYGILNSTTDLIIIDADSHEVFDIARTKLPKTFVVETSEEWKAHIYYRCENKDFSKIIFKDGLGDIRGKGNYNTICPGSKHPSGKIYKVKVDAPIAEITLDKLRGVFKDIISQHGDGTGDTVSTSIDNIKQGVKTGNRNDAAFRLICHYKDAGLDVGETTNMVMKWNRKNLPPLHDTELISCIRSAYHIEPQKKSERESLLSKYHVILWKETAEGQYVPVGVKEQKLAQMIIKELNYHFVTLEEKGKPIWYFDGKCYQKNGEIKIGEIVEEFIPELYNTHILNEVVSYIQYSNIKTRLDFTPPTNLVNLDNGIYNIDTGELLPHSHKYLFNFVIPIKYDKDAICPEYEKFLTEITSKENEPRPDVYDTLEEFLGFCFLREYIYKKYLIMDGENDNGKTTLMNIWINTIGERNIASIPLQELNDKPFRKDKLYGKHGNFSDDLSARAMHYSDVIKEITGKSAIWADIKNHQEGIWFFNYAKPFFTCNQIPETKDIGNAFFTRQLQVTLYNKYLPEGNPEINNKTCFTRDTRKEELMVTEQEKSGIFNHAMIGLQRLRENKRFTDTTTTEEKKQTWIRKSDPILTYFNEQIEETTIDWCIRCQDYVKAMEEYCKDNNITIDITLNNITRKLSELDIQKKRKSIDGQQVWVYLRIQHITDPTMNNYIGKKTENEQGELPIV